MRKGFSLMELIVSMVVIAIGLLSIASLMTVSRRSVIQNDKRSRGVGYLQEQMELLVGMGYSEVVDTYVSGDSIAANAGIPSNFTRWFLVFHDDPIGGMARARVFVSWTEKQRTWIINMETYLTRK